MGGALPFAYQWQKDGANLSGATNATLSLPNAQVSDEGWYSVIVTNRAGEVHSRQAWLEVLVPPVITLQPLNTTNLLGSPAVFSVEATSETPCSYQWFQNGIARPGETNTILNIPARQSADEGHYLVEVRNLAGTTTSRDAYLKVLVPPVICPVPDQVVTVGRQLVITNCASDPQAPISFSLGFGPPGATVSSNGIFRWTPGCALGSSTNLVQICATDSDTTPSSSCITFRVAVLECIEAALGKSIVLAGQTSSVPIQLISTTILTNMAFTVIYPVDRFTTNFTLAINSPDIITQHCEVVTPGQLQVSFTLPSNRPLYGPTKIGELGFTTLPDQPSAFVSLPIVDVTGLKPTVPPPPTPSACPDVSLCSAKPPCSSVSSATGHRS